jgi:hypothetical protein
MRLESTAIPAIINFNTLCSRFGSKRASATIPAEEDRVKQQSMTLRQMNRATLARQMLLNREKTTPLKAIEQLVALQAQEPGPPFIGLWTRLVDFQPAVLARLLHDRKVVRATTMRATLHLMSARDFVKLRPAVQSALSAAFQSVAGKRANPFDLSKVIDHARALLNRKPADFEALRAHLAHLLPKSDARVMGYAVRTHVPLVQVPTEDRWAFPARSEFALAESWIGKEMPSTGKPDWLVQRYLAAFGPATAADVQTWSGLRAMAEVLDRLRPKLFVVRGDRDQELFDLPRANRPPESVSAPIRFLPEYDNLVLAHADRTRLIADEHRKKIVTANLRVRATFLVDSRVAGTWKISRARAVAMLVIEPFDALSRSAKTELVDEGGRLIRFAEPDAKKFEVGFE